MTTLLPQVLAGSIPIYWGSPDIARHINVERIVLCDFPTPHGVEFGKRCDSEEDLPCVAHNRKVAAQYREKMRHDPKVLKCLAEVKALDADDALYEKKRSQPFLIGNKLGGSFNISNVGARIRVVIDEAEAARAAAT
jgi:hypothetical protein